MRERFCNISVTLDYLFEEVFVRLRLWYITLAELEICGLFDLGLF